VVDAPPPTTVVRALGGLPAGRRTAARSRFKENELVKGVIRWILQLWEVAALAKFP
jgi:hypothetical protein